MCIAPKRSLSAEFATSPRSRKAMDQGCSGLERGIPSLVELVTSGDDVQKEDAAEALSKLSLNMTRHEKITSAGAIPPLVALITTGSVFQKEKAARALCQLSLNSANHEKIASANGIPPLVELVRSGNHILKENAARALLNLAVNGANKEKIASAGGIPPLVELVRSGDWIGKAYAAGALWNLAINCANQEMIVSAGGIPPLVELLRSGIDVQKEYAAKALCYLSENSINHEKIASAGGIPPLVELVRSGNEAQKENAAGALWNLALENTEIRGLIAAQSRAVDHLVTLASEGTQPQRGLAAGVLGFLGSHLPSEVKMKVATQGGIEALMLYLVRPESAEWIYEGLRARHGLCANGNDTIRAIVKKCDGEVTLSSIRVSGNERIKMLAGQVLEWLEGDFAGLSEMCQHMDEAAPLCLHLLERLRTLLGSGVRSSSSVRNRLRTLLITYGGKKMVLRLVNAHSLADSLANLHQEVDSSGQQASMGGWQPRWSADRDAMMQTLFDVDIWSLVKTLEDANAQEEALTLLVHEIQEKRDAYTKQQRRFLQELLNRLAGFSSLGIPDDEKWFIPRTHVPFADESFNGGGFGKVYHGKYMNAKVVVKSVETKSESDRTDFLREVKVWHEASVHPNIAQLYGACHVGEPCFMVCKYISGGSSRVYLYEQRNLGRVCTWRVLLGATRGLQLLHSKGIVHADLKGDNILVEGDTAMITDFGMSFFAATPQPEFGKLGAIRWRAPEFIATKKASFAADVYSLGMCIVEAVTGRVPWGIVPDSAVKLHLKRKTFLTQPESMSDDEWALVCAMCNFDPSKRMALEQVEKRIREFADREEEKEAERLEMLEQPAEGSLGYFNSDSPSNVQPMMVPRR